MRSVSLSSILTLQILSGSLSKVSPSFCEDWDIQTPTVLTSWGVLVSHEEEKQGEEGKEVGRLFARGTG